MNLKRFTSVFLSLFAYFALSFYGVSESFAATLYKPGQTIDYAWPEDKLFVANYGSNLVVAISYDANGGTGNAPMGPVSCTVGSECVAPENMYSRVGYTFSGWECVSVNDNSSCGSFEPGQSLVGIVTETYKGGVILKAGWTPITYKVKFDRNKPANATGTPSFSAATKTYTYGVEGTLPETVRATLSGWEFKGFNTKADGTGTAYELGAKVLNWASEQDAVVTLYAQWEPDVKELDWYYMPNSDETVSGMPETCVYDSVFTLPQGPSRVGYTFAGWVNTGYLAIAPDTKRYQAGEEIVCRSPNFTATWTPIKFDVAYAADGGTGDAPTAPTSCTYGNTCKAPANTYSRPGYIFAGWSCTSSSGVCEKSRYEVGDSISKAPTVNDATITLTATWVLGVNNTIALDADGGTIDDASFEYSCNVENAVKLPAGVYKTGYTFVGWYNAAGEQVTTIAKGECTSDMSFTARWYPITYYVEYNANGGAVSAGGSKQTFKYGVSSELSGAAMTNGTKQFLGWSTEKDATTATYTNGQKVLNLTATDNQTITLYAVWGDCQACAAGTGAECTLSAPLGVCTYTTSCKTGYNTLVNGGKYNPSCTANTYTVVYNANGGTGTMANGVHTYDVAKALTANAFTNGTKQFLGWSTEKDATTAIYTNKQSVTNLVSTNGSTVTLYAVWGTCTACAAGTGAECTLSAPLGVCTYTTACKTGYNTLNNEGKYNPSCTVNTYTVAYNANGGTGTMASGTHTYNTAKALTANAFTNGTKQFLGWSTEKDATTAIYTNKQSVTNLVSTNGSTVTLYAVWGTCTACAAGAGAECTLSAPLGVCTYTTACKTGYNTLNNEGKYNPSCTANTFNVAYANGGGTGSAPTSPVTCTYGGTCKAPANTYSRAGYEFNGWSCTSSNGSCAVARYVAGDSIATATTVNGATITLTATWKTGADNTITLDADGGVIMSGSSVTSGSTCTVESDDIVLPTPTKTGYKFDGWLNAAGEWVATIAKGECTTDMSFTAQWTPITYKVKFDKNKPENATGVIRVNPTSATYTYGEEGVIPEMNAATLTGWEFKGFNTKADGTGIAYELGAKVLNWASEQDAVITLYAQWEPTNKELNWYYRKGYEEEVAGMPETCVYDSVFTLPQGPSRVGYTFEGWANRSYDAIFDGDVTVYKPGYELVCSSKDIASSFTAMWTINTFNVAYSAGEGSGDAPTAPTSCTYGNTCKAPANTYSRPGYIFAGWSCTSSSGVCEKSRYEVGDSISKATTVNDATITLTATWKTGADSTITLDADGGTINDTSFGYSCNVENAVKLPAGVYKTGYTFVGWYNAAGEQVTTIAKGECTSDMSFTAHWRPYEYYVAYNANGGTGTMTKETHSYDVAKALTANAFTNGNKQFLGWSTDKDAITAMYTNKESVKNLIIDYGVTVTLYAVWGTCTACAAGTGAECTLSAPLGVCTYTTSCKTGYNALKNEGKYNPSCTANTIPVYYEANGGTGDAPTSPTSCTYGTQCLTPSVTYVRKGYSATNWSCKIKSTGEYCGAVSVGSDIVDMAADDKFAEGVILSSVWTPITIPVYYEANGGTGDAPTSPTSCTYGTQCLTPSVTYVRKGYSATNWSCKIKSTGEYCGAVAVGSDIADMAADDKFAEGVILSSVWTVNTFNVAYANGGGTGSAPTLPVKCTYAETCNAPANTYSRAGYEFNGWSCTSSNGSCAASWYAVGADISTATAVNGATITLTATWKTGADSTITLDADGGVIDDASFGYSCNVGKVVTLPIPTKTGYTFTGWYNATGERVTTIAQGACTADMSFTAKWTVNTYTVVYYASGGSGTMSSTKYTYDVPGVLAKNTFTNGKKHFLGWSKSAASYATPEYTDGQQVINLSASDGAVIPLYAVWAECQACEPGAGTECSVDFVDNVCVYTTSCKTGYNTLKNEGKYNPSCTPNTFKIVYDTGVGVTLPETVCTYDKDCFLAGIDTFSKPGHVFVGWAQTFYDEWYKPGANVKNVIESGSLDLGAIWSPCTACAGSEGVSCEMSVVNNTCTYETSCLVGYENMVNGGKANASCSLATRKITYAGTDLAAGTCDIYTAVTLPTPTKTGYVFNGWYDAAGKQVTAIAKGECTADMLVTAKWTANTIVLNWTNGGRGTAPTSPETCTYDSTFTMPAAMTSTGYTFEKWNVNGKSFAAGSSVVCSVANLGVVDGSVMIEGSWIVNKYTCLAGQYLDGTTCKTCTEGYYCPLSSTYTYNADVQGRTVCPTGYKSEAGAYSAEECYVECKAYDVEYGKAEPVAGKEFWPAQCRYEAFSVTGNPCDIVDGVCVEKSCNYNYEMIGGFCKACARENAVSYKKTGGNCVVESCASGFHPNGQSCESDVIECSASNAVYASRVWNSTKNAFGECVITECKEGYHLGANTCQLDEQTCELENGVGTRVWNHKSKTWGDCVATKCDPGYTNDRSMTNELWKQCGRCNNAYGAGGEIAVSSYARGCEIASCMYEGELYTLENNECRLICDTYSDETGSRRWNASRKKCEHTCTPGYMQW